MRIVVSGPKGSGKSTVSAILGETLGLPVVETDDLIVDIFAERGGGRPSVPEIYAKLGGGEFRQLELEAVARAAAMDWRVLAMGGSTLLNPDARRLLRPDSIWVFLDAPVAKIWPRIMRRGLPAYLSGVEHPERLFAERVERSREILSCAADIVIDITELESPQVASLAVERIAAETASRVQAPNTFGQIIRLTTFGESHGPMIGAVLDGVPPGVPLAPEDIQVELDRRRPGGKLSTKRGEKDQVKIVSGVFEGVTTGAAIGMLIENTDAKSGHYEALREIFRPGHADFTFWRKYGVRDHRGGGRSSGRETACRVAGGAVAKKILASRGVTINAYVVRIGDVVAETLDLAEAARNPARCPDKAAAARMEAAVAAASAAGDSLGGIVQAEVDGLPPGLGDPVFGKLDARLGAALFSIGAVKGVEFGAGFAAARMAGSANNDPIVGGKFAGNNAGGVLGGISNGDKLLVRVAIKPTPSISRPQQTCDIHGAEREIRVEGRHDPCIAPRAVPVVESMIALTLLDLWEMQSRLRPDWP